MEDDASQVLGGEATMEGSEAHGVGISRGNGGACASVRRHKFVSDQSVEQRCPALEVAIPTSAHSSRQASGGGQ